MADNKIFAKYTDAETFNKIVDYSSLTDMWESSVKSCGDSLAVIDEDKEYTYSQLDAEIAAFRAVLTDRGIKAGDVVGLLAPNSVGFIKAYIEVVYPGAPTDPSVSAPTSSFQTFSFISASGSVSKVTMESFISIMAFSTAISTAISHNAPSTLSY